MAGEGAPTDIVTHMSSANFRADADRPITYNDIRSGHGERRHRFSFVCCVPFCLSAVAGFVTRLWRAGGISCRPRATAPR
jgi:hypothetical protein